MLPKFKDLDQRRKAVASLRMDVATKKLQIDSVLEARLQELTQQGDAGASAEAAEPLS